MSLQQKLVAYIEKKFNIAIASIQVPPQGMSSSVFFVKTSEGREYAVKYGENAMKDLLAFDLITKSHVDIPIPVLFQSFQLEGVSVVILKKIQFPLLESMPVDEMPKYVPSMIKHLRLLHTIKSGSPRLLTEPTSQKTWKEMMLSIFDGSAFDWAAVSDRKGLDKDLVLSSVNKIIEKINNISFDKKEYSLLHTDFNQRNLFVNESTHEISGIIDWEDAMFGDPIYDFARVRMYLWHFNFGKQIVDDYYKMMNFTPQEKMLEDLYWLSRVIQYLGWYSEELTEFNEGRIKYHQDFLRTYKW